MKDIIIGAWGLTLVLLTIALVIVAVRQEKKSFNKGVCPKCKMRLTHFDNDSQGGRGYKCNGCGKYTTWVSWKAVDKSFFKTDE